MKPTAKAVIGANYGDEGKGRVVDWLAASSGPNTVVVRSNGGAQAGHTVVRAPFGRHVFHHFGSATLRGARTHLSRFMVSHPILFAEERAALRQTAPQVSADPHGMVTTPWDMMVNQAIEHVRGDGRHGSCGLGFGETVGRNEETPYRLTIGDLLRPGLAAKLRQVREEWLPDRLAQLGLDPSVPPLNFAGSAQVMDRFVDQCATFVEQVRVCDDATLGDDGSAILFEAAQGLLLDQNADGFPFLTRSQTGLANMLAIAEDAGLEGIDPLYVSRCYLTRHGRGAMEDERAIDQWFCVEDRTNQPNPWQETLRFGLLDPALLGRRIAADLSLALGRMAIQPSLALTCLDQARGPFAWRAGDAVQVGSVEEMRTAFARGAGLGLGAEFWSVENA